MEGSKKNDVFESEWAAAFEGAETQPSPNVWKNIMGELATQQVFAYKKKAFIYQMLAAASVIFAVGLSVIYFFSNTEGINNLAENAKIDKIAPMVDDENQTFTLTQTDETTEENTSGAMQAAVLQTTKPSNTLDDKIEGHKSKAQLDNGKAEINKGIVGAALIASADNSNTSINKNTKNKSGINTSTSVLTLNPDQDVKADNPASVILLTSTEDVSNTKANESSMLTYLDAKYAALDFQITPKALPEFFYKIPIYNVQEVKAEEITDNKFWAGVNVGSGSFDPNFGAPKSFDIAAMSAREELVSQVSSLDGQLVPLVEETNAGVSYTVGIEVGKKIAPRWILLTGLQYGVYGASSRTNQTYWDGESDATLPISFQNQIELYSQRALIIRNDNVAVDNKFQLLAVPVKMGYILVDKKVNVLLNLGLSGDFYLGNRLSANTENVGDYNFAPGNKSPYRNVHLSGLAGIQIGYRIGENYYINIEPNYRQSITEFTKTGQPYSSNPSRAGVAVGFRYNF